MIFVTFGAPSWSKLKKCVKKSGFFFAPGCLNNWGKGWSFSVILAWDNQKGTFLTHFFNFGHEGAPNVTKITYNMIIWWENSPRKKIGAVSFTGGWAILFKKKKIWTVPLILQFNIYMWDFFLNFRYTVKEHVETHISGFCHQCPLCSKTCKTRNALRVHTIRKHNQRSTAHSDTVTRVSPQVWI